MMIKEENDTARKLEAAANTAKSAKSTHIYIIELLQQILQKVHN